jgi:hypothetical protein
MNTLSQHMQERLDKWKKDTQMTHYDKNDMKIETVSRRSGKKDHGDIISIEQWEEEIRRSQIRR